MKQEIPLNAAPTEQVIGPLKSVVRFLYSFTGGNEMRRKNRGKDAPYSGLVIPGTTEPFSSENLRQQFIQGEEPIDVLIRLAYELGRASYSADTERLNLYEQLCSEGVRPQCEYDSVKGFQGWGWRHELYPTLRDALDAILAEPTSTT